MTEKDSQEFLFVLDGGGTKTRAIVTPAADPQAKPFVEVEAGPANFGRIGSEGLGAVINELIVKLPEHFRSPAALVAGLAGVGREAERQKAEAALHKLFPDIPVIVRTDAELAYAGAFGLQPGGVLVIAGTGSIAWTQLSDGRFLRAGGWGPLLGDEGGGAWLGREVLRLCLRQGETGKLSPFARAILKTIQITKPTEILTKVYREHWGPEHWATLAPVVFEYAGKDKEADALIEKTSAALAKLAGQLLEQMPLSPDSVPVSVVGGLTVHWERIEPFFLTELQKESLVKHHLVTPIGDALFGGRLVAQKHGIP